MSEWERVTKWEHKFERDRCNLISTSYTFAHIKLTERHNYIRACRCCYCCTYHTTTYTQFHIERQIGSATFHYTTFFHQVTNMSIKLSWCYFTHETPKSKMFIKFKTRTRCHEHTDTHTDIHTTKQRETKTEKSIKLLTINA